MNQHLTSDRLIGYHRAKQDYVESPLNALQFGYGDHRYVKMTYQLLRQDDKLKEKILKQIIQDFSLAENVSLAILSSDFLSVILEHLKNKVQNIRYYSATIFRKVCATPLGRKTIITKNCIEEFQHLIHDNVVRIKGETYQGLIQFSQYTQGINFILSKDKILVNLVDKLVQQKNAQILLKAIILLKILMQGQQGTPLALKTQIISRLMNLINHQNPQIQFNVCMALSNISFNEAGKEAIVTKGYIKDISNYIRHEDNFVRQASSLLLCSLAQLNQGKIQILTYCEFKDIQNLLTDSNNATVLNIVQLIASIAENPKGRALGISIQQKLQKITSIERKYIDETLQVIRWMP